MLCCTYLVTFYLRYCIAISLFNPFNFPPRQCLDPCVLVQDRISTIQQIPQQASYLWHHPAPDREDLSLPSDSGMQQASVGQFPLSQSTCILTNLRYSRRHLIMETESDTLYPMSLLPASILIPWPRGKQPVVKAGMNVLPTIAITL